MPLDMKYLEFCQDGSPFYVPSKSATVNPYKVDIPKEWSKHIHGPWTSLDLSLVEWGVGGVVTGVVGAIMPVGCDGLPRVALRWSGLSRGQGCSFRVVVGRRQWSGACGAGRA